MPDHSGGSKLVVVGCISLLVLVVTALLPFPPVFQDTAPTELPLISLLPEAFLRIFYRVSYCHIFVKPASSLLGNSALCPSVYTSAIHAEKKK